MPWKTTDVMEERWTFLLRAARGIERMSELSREFGVSRKTGYRWLRRYREVGRLSEVREASRRPHQSPERIAPEQEARVTALRIQYGWGARKLQVLLEREGIRISVATINRVIRRNGLLRDKDLHIPAVKRFEREHPNELWQMDFKGPMEGPAGKCLPLSILDDHSRYAVGLYPLAGTKGEPVWECLERTFERYGVPEAMLMDHGVPWWGSTNGHGLTVVSVRLIKQGVNLLYGRIRHPQTQGKVERFNRTVQDAIRHRGRPEHWGETLEEIRHEYNHVRPHEALGMEVPARRYRPSPRMYRPHPPEWEYPAGSVVKRLNTQGCMDYDRRRYFVSESLSGEWVRLEFIAGRVIVQYRQMFIREIDLERGETYPFVQPASSPIRWTKEGDEAGCTGKVLPMS